MDESRSLQERLKEKLEIYRQVQAAEEQTCQNCREPLNTDEEWVKITYLYDEESETVYPEKKHYCVSCVHPPDKTRFRLQRSND